MRCRRQVATRGRRGLPQGVQVPEAPRAPLREDPVLRAHARAPEMLPPLGGPPAAQAAAPRLRVARVHERGPLLRQALPQQELPRVARAGAGEQAAARRDLGHVRAAPRPRAAHGLRREPVLRRAGHAAAAVGEHRGREHRHPAQDLQAHPAGLDGLSDRTTAEPRRRGHGAGARAAQGAGEAPRRARARRRGSTSGSSPSPSTSGAATRRRRRRRRSRP